MVKNIFYASIETFFYICFFSSFRDDERKDSAFWKHCLSDKNLYGGLVKTAIYFSIQILEDKYFFLYRERFFAKLFRNSAEIFWTCHTEKSSSTSKRAFYLSIGKLLGQMIYLLGKLYFSSFPDIEQKIFDHL